MNKTRTLQAPIVLQKDMSKQASFKVALQETVDGKVDLKNMSLDALDSFLTVVDSFKQIAREVLTVPEEIFFSIEEGSAALEVRGPAPAITTLTEEIAEAVAGKSDNKIVAKSMRVVQDQVKRRNMHYSFTSSSQKGPRLIEALKNAKRIRTARQKREKIPRLRVLKGFLNAVGGQQPNYHFDYGGGQRTKIACTQLEAQRVNKYLYADIHVLVWELEFAAEDKASTYEHRAMIEDADRDCIIPLRRLFKKYYDEPELVERLMFFYYFAEDHLPRSYGLKAMQLLLRGFDHKYSDRNELKTLLIITKGFRDHPTIAEDRQAVLERYNEIAAK